MYEVIYSTKFKKDYKLAVKRNWDIELLRVVITQLSEGKALAPKHRDHNLQGQFTDFRECHIKPDWLLIYRINAIGNTLELVATGTHSDLF
ncbi:addiction module toxin, RelE/StbE family [Bacteroidia bacterium]|nr:addiction module toxin, RelE/StbE family [Bacteroidia bacterium]